jgi:hypothetical protein
MLVKQMSSHVYEVSASRSEWWTAYNRNGGWQIISYRGKELSPNNLRAKQIKRAIREHLDARHAEHAD